jgi:catechol 2,3-dioxygenase-like lactoylglutathione lyase family enzyme
MIARHLHHISFAVRDLAAARAFYEDLLGLETIPRPELGIGGVWYRSGDCEVHLIEMPAGAPAGARATGPISPLANHQAFAIEDYEKVREALRARGVEVLETSRGRGQMWIRDPDGNVIELVAPRG